MRVRPIDYNNNEFHKFILVIPELNDERRVYWNKMPDDVYEHKIYPICVYCKERYVPIKDYKNCFKCEFKKR